MTIFEGLPKDEVRSRYRKLALLCHPDKVGAAEAELPEELGKIAPSERFTTLVSLYHSALSASAHEDFQALDVWNNSVAIDASKLLADHSVLKSTQAHTGWELQIIHQDDEDLVLALTCRCQADNFIEQKVNDLQDVVRLVCEGCSQKYQVVLTPV